MSKSKSWSQKHPNAITESLVASGVKNKVKRMEEELKRNPNNSKTAERLGEMRKMHADKLR